jgi:hypothetical protein
MKDVASKVANAYRTNTNPKANPNNRITVRRRRMYDKINKDSGGDENAKFQTCMNILKRNRGRLQSYIISRNETPMDSLEDLTLQAYALRCNEIESTARMMGVTEGEAGIFLEEDESDMETANNPDAKNRVGELFAPIGIAAKHISTKGDNFVDAGLVSGIINTVGSKVDKGTLKRAAENKPSGLLGFLSGGKKQYELLRSYLQDPKNVDEKNAVLKGIITEVTQLKGYGGQIPASGGTQILPGGVNIAGIDVLKAIEDQKKKEAIKKMLPMILIGLAVIILIVVLITKNANRNKG